MEREKREKAKKKKLTSLNGATHIGFEHFRFPSFFSFIFCFLCVSFCVHFFHLAFIQRPGRFIHLIAQCLDAVHRRRGVHTCASCDRLDFPVCCAMPAGHENRRRTRTARGQRQERIGTSDAMSNAAISSRFRCEMPRARMRSSVSLLLPFPSFAVAPDRSSALRGELTADHRGFDRVRSPESGKPRQTSYAAKSSYTIVS